MGAPVSDKNLSVYSRLGHPPIELEGDLVSDYSYYWLPNSPFPDSDITTLSHPSPPNTSKEGDIYREGAQSDTKCNYRCKKWHKPVCE